MKCQRCGKWAGAHATLPGQSRDDLCLCAPAQAEQPAVPAWQPIETAPKDGTRVILVGPFGNVWCDCRWEKMTRVPDRWSSFVGVVPFDPTHWMPIPAPPATAPKEQA